MKIKDILFEIKKYDFYKPFHITNSISTSKDNIEITLITDTGIAGKGEASSSFRVNGENVNALYNSRDQIIQLIKGMDVTNYRKIFNQIDKIGRTSPSLKAGVQFAVLDTLSNYLNFPVYKLLGGEKDYVVTDKTISIGTLEETLEEAEDLSKKGFRYVKMKVGEDIKSDIERLTAVNEKFNFEGFIVDANMGYSVKEAITFSDAMYRESVPINVFEQPVHYSDFDGLKVIRYASRYPVGADETIKTKYDALRLIKDDCVDFINIKLMKSGVSDALSIIEISKTANVSLMIGCMSESATGVNQSVQLAAGTGAFAYCDLDSHLLLKESGEYKFKTVGDKLYPH